MAPPLPSKMEQESLSLAREADQKEGEILSGLLQGPFPPQAIATLQKALVGISTLFGGPELEQADAEQGSIPESWIRMILMAQEAAYEATQDETYQMDLASVTDEVALVELADLLMRIAKDRQVKMFLSQPSPKMDLPASMPKDQEDPMTSLKASWR